MFLKGSSLSVDEVCDVIAQRYFLPVENGQILHFNQCWVGSLGMTLVLYWTVTDVEVAFRKLLASFFSLACINGTHVGKGSMIDLRVRLEVAFNRHLILRASLVTHVDSPHSVLNPFDLLLKRFCVLYLLWGHKCSLVHALVLE